MRERKDMSSRLILTLFFFFFFCISVIAMSRITCAYCLHLPEAAEEEEEAQGLLTFKAAITLDPFSCLASWTSSSSSSSSPTNANNTSNASSSISTSVAVVTRAPPAHCIAWYGVLCDNTSFHVTSLNLSKCELSGTIAPHSLGLLRALSVLDLSHNKFSGEIPPSLFYSSKSSNSSSNALTYLHLSMNNFLSGPIPDSLALNSPNLQTLFLSVTNLSGPVPPALWTHLPALQQLVIILANDFSGPVLRIPPASFPRGGTEFAFCNTIQIFILEGLDASGESFPAVLGACRHLRILSLSYMRGLVGEIPASIWQLPNLQQLVIHDENVIEFTANNPYEPRPYKLHGSMPLSFGFCSNGSIPSIQQLSIQGINLTGHIPSAIAACGASLQQLEISTTSVEGPIPSGIGNLTQLLMLFLQGNNLTGNIPPLLSGCSQLVELHLRFNRLSGPIPGELGLLTNLKTLALDDNRLHGPIPAELGALSQLQTLDLSQNNLQGNLPEGLFRNLTDLVTFHLFQNNLTGKIESFDLSKMPNLQAFSIYENALHGGLPAGLTENRALIIFDVQGNRGLTGALGSTTTYTALNITSLSNLRVLSVSYNQLSGDIPPWLWKLPSLQVLDLSNNRFTGRLPETLTYLSYFKLNQSLSIHRPTLYEYVPIIIKSAFSVLTYVLSTRIYFDVSMNNLEGEIPNSFGELSGLTGVNLSHNRIQGIIPVGSFGTLRQLEVLDLSYNQLDGGIPEDLTSLNSLSTLNLSSNLLQGSIPTQNNFDTRFGPSSFGDNSGLCGYPLPICNASGNGTCIDSNKVSPQLVVKIWLNEFVSPWAFVMGYLTSLALSIFLLIYAASIKIDPSTRYK